MESNQSIHQITRKSGSNLALSFVSLPREKKEAMSVFYAFCRLVDDISDDKTRPVSVKQAELEQWREEIRACYKGQPATAHGRELQNIIRAHLIPPQPFLDIIDGVEMDLTLNRYRTFAELHEYCYRVASAVGLVSIEIFGYTRPAAKEYAVALGLAFQLTNILRDVRYDLVTYGRIYLPLEEMEACGVVEADLLSTEPHAGRTRLYRMQYYRAQHFFHKAARLLPPEDKKSFIAAELMTEVYHRLLAKIRAAGFPNPEKPIRLNKWEKILAVQHARNHGARVNRTGLVPPRKVTVWGAGFAGLNAALQAGLHGHIPEVLESKSYAGGRAHSFSDARSGTILDNGQHIFMGCYPSCLELFDLLGVTHKLDRQDAIEVPYLSANGASVLKASAAPAPFHLLSALWNFKEFSARDRLAVLGMGLRLRFGGGAGDAETVDHWLNRLGQSPGAIRALWEPLCIAALNEPIASASAPLFETVLRRSIFGNRSASSIYISRVGLSDLLLPEARIFLESIGGSLHLGEGVQSVRFEGRQVASVTTTRGREITGSVHISALPWSALRALLPESGPGPAQLAGRIAAIEGAPIIAVHLFTDRQLINQPFVGFLDSPLHWIFDRSHQVDPGTAEKLSGLPGAEGRPVDTVFLSSVVISAAYELAALPTPEFLLRMRAELERLIPEARGMRLLHHVVYKSKDATFAARPGVASARPGPTTDWENLFLAGDWTDTGLPATLEGAAWSGKTAARSIDPAISQ
ncbi:MAG: hydroxysqualene dehydroxylase HpnE [Candidatus Methylacidiphilales bacterium]|nr:hydroxysqualene dehydroxylase HpnE [Candidatus Methylacidiphilales bacterium]